MKCERCGKNEATFYYKSSINGKVTELHLCPECAEALGYTESLRSTWRRPLSLFDDDFFSRPFGLLEPLFDGFGTRLLTEFPALQSERRRNALRSQLDAAVREERYEDAARLRDELRSLPQE